MTARAARVLLLALLAASCSPPDGSGTLDVDGVLERMTLPERAAQLVLVPLPADPGQAAPLERRIGETGAGGVLLREGAAGPASRAVALLQAGAEIPLLVAAEVDGGVGALLAGATEFPSTAALAALAPPEDVRAAGAHVAREAREIGVNLGLVSAPPLNDTGPLPLLARDPARTARGMAAFLAGAEEQGLPVSVRSLWLPGGARPLDWDRARLEAVELPVLRAAVDAGARAVELGAARLPAVSGDSLPLPFSPAAVGGLLRRDLGWRGIVAVDLGPDSELVRAVGTGEAAVRAVAAGADLLLGPEHPDSVVTALVAAVEQGRLSRERIAAAARRVLGLKARLPLVSAADSAAPRLRSPEAVALAARLALETALPLPAADGAEPALDPGADSVLLVTPLGRGRALAAALTAARPGVRHLPLNPTADPALLAARLAREAAGADLLLLADFPARGGREGLEPPAGGEESADTLPPRRVRIRFRPESLDLPGAEDPSLVVWGDGPASQVAAARMLVAPPPAGKRPPMLRWPPAPALRSAEPEAVGMDAGALESVDRVIREAIDEGVFSGAALAVGRRGGLVRLRGYGRTAPGEAGAPVSAETTLFDLASLSKVVGTTTAVALLVDAGRMRLDAPLRRYLPGFRGEDKEGVAVRHVLTHTSGLPSGIWLYGSADTPREALRQVLRQPLRGPPGTRVEYSDLGMILLAEAAESAAGMPLDRLLALRVFAPLGMESTMYLPPHFLRDRTVPTAPRSERGLALRGVVHDANAFRLGGIAGHAGLFSTARDVAVFAQTMLNGGSYGTVRVLSPEVVAAFARRQPGAEQRALGWDTPSRVSSAGSYFSERSFGHTGFTGTSLWIDPEKELFVVLLTSRTYTEASAREMLRVRADVHDAVARAIRDQPARRRRGAR